MNWKMLVLAGFLPVAMVSAQDALPAAEPTKPAESPLPGKTPAEIAKAFFTTLQEDKVDRAYDLLVKGTIIEPREQELQTLRSKTQKALDEYGPVNGYELVKDEWVGSHLVRQTYVLLTKQLPLRWRFYFYETDGTWKLIDLRVDDALVELFDDTARKRP